jgi:tryptophanyl-tRNA synthetase
MNVVSAKETVQFFDDAYNNCTVRYGDMKKQLAEDIEKFVAPLREKIEALTADEKYLNKIMDMGKEKAHASSSTTVKEVRDIMGISYR